MKGFVLHGILLAQASPGAPKPELKAPFAREVISDGLLSLRPSKPVATGDFVYIIQHPKGRSKKIRLLHNEVVRVTQDRVQYLTDTLPGSSGSPVCNELWQV